MLFDRTEIEIRHRGSFELFDLSILVFKRHFWKLTMAGALLGIPLLILDVAMIYWMVSEDAILIADNQMLPNLTVGFRYLSHLVVLQFTQIQLATLPVTLLLGSQVFYQPLNFRELLVRTGRLWGPALGILGIFRLGLIPILIEPWVDRTVVFDPIMEVLIFCVVFVLAIIFQMFWPFAPEIVGLEQCPYRTTKPGVISYSTRRRSLHGPMMTEVINYFILAALFATLLLAMMIGSALFFQAIATGNWQWGWLMYFVIFPCCLWMAGLFVATFRFLAYIDTRIRLEGWEIDLRMRAEGQRIQQSLQPTIGSGSGLDQGSSA